jgi:hypothetical protein
MLVTLLGATASSCSSGPSSSAQALCGSVSATSTPANVLVAVPKATIEAGEHSGNRTLDDAATTLLSALRGQDPTAISEAERHIAATCSHLGIALGKVGAGL